MSNTFLLSLGANQVSPVQALDSAKEKIAANPEVIAVESSGDWLTSPWGPVKQSWFVNRCLFVQTNLGAHDLLKVCQQVEGDLGRKRLVRWGSRVIDIDLIWADTIEVSDDELSLPHPRAAEREFVLRPWLELDANAVLRGQSVSRLIEPLSAMNNQSVCVRYQ
jgi:2-amino-4-hydroxy-6-hydroxymethyldihydropteridine diphosphokinase